MIDLDPCNFAMKRYVDKLRWLNLWTALLWIFGVTLIVFCSVAILLFIRETWLPGALTVVGAIVNGAGIAWVLARRKEAETEERDAFNVFSVECAGRKAGKIGPPTGPPPPSPRIFSQRELRSIAWQSLLKGKLPEELSS
jgi:hypothetical protein